MESPQSVPYLNLESIASDRRGKDAEPDGRKSNGSEDVKNEMETQTYGVAGVGGGCKSEMENSKSSFELLEEAKRGGNLTVSSFSSTSSSSSFSCVFRHSKNDRRLKRHHPGRTDNLGSNAFETNESSHLPDSISSSPAKDAIAPADADKHLQISQQQSRRAAEKLDKEREGCLESAVKETIVAENKKLKEVLSRERRHHFKEKNRIRQVLIAIDEALSTLPSRLGKIRMQNQKNLMKMNSFPVEYRDRGDFQMVVGNCPKYLENARQGKRTSVQFSEDVYSDMSNSGNTHLFRKIESLNNLIEAMKRGQAAPIEAVVNNELCAISLLKNEIKYTKKKIEQKSRTDLDSATVANWRAENGEVPYPKNWCPRRVADSEDIKKLEKYIWLQREAINALSAEVEKTKQLCVRDMKEKEQFQSERKLLSEMMKLKKIEESQGSKTRSSDITTAAKPFRTIKELKGQLEEKEKTLANSKAKISRLEAAVSNKGTLLDNERRKAEDLEAKLKILAAENKSFSIQINSLQYVNRELKEQMDVLKNQIEILIEKNAELCKNNPNDLKRNVTEIMDMLKKEDARARTGQEEAERKLKEQQMRHLEEIEMLKVSYERCEKQNCEYLRTLKGLILYLHSYEGKMNVKRKGRNSYGKVKEILGINDGELENLLGENLKNNSEKELQDLYDQCHFFVNGEDDCEFSLKLSAWLFDLIKQKILIQNFNESLSD